MGGPIALKAPKLESPCGKNPTFVYGQSAPGSESPLIQTAEKLFLVNYPCDLWKVRSVKNFIKINQQIFEYQVSSVKVGWNNLNKKWPILKYPTQKRNLFVMILK
jgi:hypothetical protein